MKDLPKAFNPTDYENKLYSMWEESGVFHPNWKLKTENSNAFCVIMPPPNANGSLHIGHAVFVALEDLMIRYHRMKGELTLWLPGVDHAGFETQVVFERKLEKEGKTRFQFSRDELYKMMWDFTKANKKDMEDQLRRLGASCDWTREKFTLDPEIIEIVYQTFKKLYQDGLAYHGQGIVNWCPRHQTSLSDLETRYEERIEPLYFLQYGPFTIATARPETKFGDKYVVMHPADKRYLNYKHGDQLDVDWLNGKVKATVIKDDVVDPKFGTGVMTITPWHDPIDFEIAKRHNLEMEQIIDVQGKLLSIAGEFAGQHIKKARPLILEKLKSKGLVKKIDANYTHSVQVCYKCGTVIEPQVREQWHIAMKAKIRNPNAKIRNKSLQELGLEAVDKKEVIFVNKRFEKIYKHWLNNIRDWNVSRQIVWGIPINAWYCSNNHTTVELPKTIKLIAIRHGESVHNVKGIVSGDHSRNNYDLTDNGLVQVRQIVANLKDEQIDAIYASQFLRTQKTAQALAKSHKLKFKIDPLLNDIISGELEGVTMHKARQLTDHWRQSIGGSETIFDIQKRVIDFFTAIASQHPNQTIVIVSSEIVLHILEQTVKGKPPSEHDDSHPAPGSYKTLAVTLPLICDHCGEAIRRDSDVFDTWFSSGQWPFATLLAQSRSDFEKFYPTSVMETGHDILFFWVARMIMLGKYSTGKAPFKYVYLHGLVRDKDRQKMSKSKGNVIDPLGVIDLYGSDALRMALIFGVAGGSDIIISEEKIRGMRNFANKVWNMSRFILMNREIRNPKSEIRKGTKTKLEKQLDFEVKTLVKRTTQHIDKFRFHQAAETLYSFTWHRFADYYIEESKKGYVSFSVILNSLFVILKLLHPFMPFVTEAIWQNLRQRKLVREPMLISAHWPK